MIAPRLLTTRQAIRDVAQRWHAQYCRSGKWGTTISGNSEDVYNALKALNPETATPADVARIIGHGGWTLVVCNSCRRSVERAVEVGELPDYESATAVLCEECLMLAVELIRAP